VQKLPRAFPHLFTKVYQVKTTGSPIKGQVKKKHLSWQKSLFFCLATTAAPARPRFKKWGTLLNLLN
jgi:hypothetical protein